MPPKVAAAKAKKAEKPAPPSLKQPPPLPPPKFSLGANHAFAMTDEYCDQKTYFMDLVVYMTGNLSKEELPTVRIANANLVQIFSQFNKNILSSDLPRVLGLREDSARYQAYASIGQDLASSDKYKSEAERDFLTGAPQNITLPVRVKVNRPETTVHPYYCKNKCEDTKGGKHKQFNSVLIVQLEVDKPWVEVRGGIKSGGTISLLGSSQSSEESPPPRTKRGGGGDGGGKGGWKGEGKKIKLNSVEVDDEDEDD